MRWRERVGKMVMFAVVVCRRQVVRRYSLLDAIKPAQQGIVVLTAGTNDQG